LIPKCRYQAEKAPVWSKQVPDLRRIQEQWLVQSRLHGQCANNVCLDFQEVLK